LTHDLAAARPIVILRKGTQAMAFIKTIPVAEATGDAKKMYEENTEPSGEVPNYVKLFSHRPAIYNAFGQLGASIKPNMDLRRYELVTVATALELESSYCALAHGQILSDKILGVQQTALFVRDFGQTDLTPAEKAMVAYVRKMTRRSSSVTQEDVDELKQHGFSDAEILDIAAACALRCFFSKLLDAVGAVPDASYASMPDELKTVLTVGREIEKAPAA
jgi:uncharacterized peroxidase-related enzyme